MTDKSDFDAYLKRQVEGMQNICPSQQAERFQSVDPKPFVPPPSMIERWADWWGHKRLDREFWMVVLGLVSFCVGAVYLIVTM